MRAGSGCNNTGRIADVNFHEWGHAFHYYGLESGDFDGAVSEGIGDVVSALNTGDSIIAPNFLRQEKAFATLPQTGCIRMTGSMRFMRMV